MLRGSVTDLLRLRQSKTMPTMQCFNIDQTGNLNHLPTRTISDHKLKHRHRAECTIRADSFANPSKSDRFISSQLRPTPRLHGETSLPRDHQTFPKLETTFRGTAEVATFAHTGVILA